jgi:hypothetical protein
VKPKETPPPRPVEAGPTAAERVARLSGEAETAYAQRHYDDAAALYDAILKLDAQNEAATRGRARVAATHELSRRSFVVATTSVESGGGGGKGPSGFDSSDIDLKKAPKDAGSFQVEIDPKPAAPGDPFTVRIAVNNLGKKTLKIDSLTATTTVNGTPSGGRVAAKVSEVASGKKAVVYEIVGSWIDGTSSWRLDLALVTGRGDTLRTQVTWK